jgi:DNA-binding transcriptional LysR family regulator
LKADKSMNLKQLEYALAVADTGSFTRAAERCHVVQSALSHQVARLEAQLGVSLFERSSRRVRLTPAGEAFVLSARPAVEAARRIADDVAAACGQVRGRLAIGEISSLTALDLVDLLAVFHGRFPDVDVRWLTAKSELQMVDVVERRLEVGNFVLWQGEAVQVAMEMAERLAQKPNKALQACKRAIDIAADEPEDQAIAKALQLSDEVFDTNDAREGARAFFHKEKPAFTHS